MSKKIEKETANAILKGIKIPPQPQIMVDIQMEMAMPGFSLEDIAQLIARDVGIAGGILKTVNSSYFGLKNKITSIAQATSLLGLDSVVNIVNAICIASSLSDDEVSAMTGFWDNAMDLAAASALIAKSVCSCPPDEAYVMGLFHNAAIPLLMQRFPDYLQVLEEAYSQNDKRITEYESDRFDTNHSVIGYYVAQAWKLPDHICQAIAEHHDCEQLFGSDDIANTKLKNLLSVLKLSEHLCGTYRVLGKQDEDYEFERLRKPLLAYLGLSDIDLDNLQDDLFDKGIVTT